MANQEARRRSSVSEPGGGRKRTLVVSLLALGAGAAGVGAYMGSGSETATANRIYTSQQQCERDSAVPAEDCRKQFVAAKAAHEKAAPLFPSKEACEGEYGDGKCTNPSSGTRHSYYIPAMTGYMMGRAASGGYQSAPLYQRRGDPPGQYRQMAAFPQPQPGTSPSSRSSTGSSFRTRTYRTNPGSSRVYTPSRSVSRGGFGSSSRGFSGG